MLLPPKPVRVLGAGGCALQWRPGHRQMCIERLSAANLPAGTSPRKLRFVLSKLRVNWRCCFAGQNTVACLLMARCAYTSFGAATKEQKNLSTSVPLAFVLQAVGFYCCQLGVSMEPDPVAGAVCLGR